MGVYCVNGRAAANESSPVISDAGGAAAALSVVVTCHPAYTRFLPECIASIERQRPAFLGKVLAWDGPPNQAPAPEGWTVVSGQWHNPNTARNAALQEVPTPWVIYWDADDAMPPGFAGAAVTSIQADGRRAAIHYPDVFRDGGSGRPTPTEWDYWTQRQRLFISTCSAWRVDAIRGAGGWDESSPLQDDANLAARITERGWTARRLGVPVGIRGHGFGHRSQPNGCRTLEAANWRVRSLAVVALLAGRQWCFADWVSCLAVMDFPPRSSLYLVTNGGGVPFRRELSRAMDLFRDHFDRVQVIQPRHANADGLDRSAFGRHALVADLYNEVLPGVREDLVLTWEDDVLPPAGGVQALASHFLHGSTVGAASGVYESHRSPGRITGPWPWIGGPMSPRWRTSRTGRWGRGSSLEGSPYLPGGRSSGRSRAGPPRPGTAARRRGGTATYPGPSARTAGTWSWTAGCGAATW